MSNTLPSFLVLGVEKGGTTWLYHQLIKHPEIFLPGTKEIHYFNKLNSNLHLKLNYENLGVEWYSNFFKGAENHKAIGEITPMYICDELAPKRIHNLLPSCKMIVIFRNPVERAYSQYWMAYRKNHLSASFKEIVNSRDARILPRGNYGSQLKRYYDYFDRDQILLFEYKNFFKNPSQSLIKICEFLNVSPAFFADLSQVDGSVYKSPKYRSSYIYNLQKRVSKKLRENRWTSEIVELGKRLKIDRFLRSMNELSEDYPEIPLELKRELIAYYENETSELEELSGLNLSHWRE